MAEKNQNNQFASWYSTYGLMTVERVLAILQIEVSHEEVIQTLKNPHHFMHSILHVPMLNIFNGIIFQQAYDYQIYAQKLMIDYRLSPEYAKDADAPGASIRKDLDDQFKELSDMVKAMGEHQYQHYQIISESQAYLIETIGSTDGSLKAIEQLGNDGEFQDKLIQFRAKSQEMTTYFRDYRRQFYDIILAISDRLASLSEYHFDVELATKERESLFFDREIGDN